MDGDGQVEILARHPTDNNSIIVFSHGTPGPLVSTELPISGSTNALAVGDVNDDGFPDLIHGYSNAGGAILLLANGAGGFSESSILFGGSDRHNWEFYELDLVDLDGDGDLDLLGAAEAGLHVWRNDQNLIFFHVNSDNAYNTGRLPKMTYTDLNDDGRTDVLMGTKEGYFLVMLSQPDGTLSETQRLTIDTNQETRKPTLLDWDNDGDLDVALASTHESSGSPILYFLENDGGTFVLIDESEPLPADAVWIQAGDLNRDGCPDLVLANRNEDVTYFLGDGASRFIGPQVLSSQTISPILFDLEGDGDLDLWGGRETEPSWLYINE
jgi:hypothetical protein